MSEAQYPENWKGGERRKELVVVDRPAEKGITLNNIISFLVLCVMAWVGTNIEEIKKSLSSLTTATTVNASNINHNSKAVDKLRHDLEKHIHEGHRRNSGP